MSETQPAMDKDAKTILKVARELRFEPTEYDWKQFSEWVEVAVNNAYWRGFRAGKRSKRS